MKKWILILFMVVLNSILLLAVINTQNSDSLKKYMPKQDIEKHFYNKNNDKEYYEKIEFLKEDKGIDFYSVNQNLYGIETNSVYVVSKDSVRLRSLFESKLSWDISVTDFDEIILKRPIKISERWIDESGKERVIIGIEKIKIMGDTFDAIVVECQGYLNIDTKYFVKELGLVRIKNGNDDIILNDFIFTADK